MTDIGRTIRDFFDGVRGPEEAAETAPAAAATPGTAPDMGAPSGIDRIAAASVVGIFENQGPLRAKGIEDHRNPAAIERAMTSPLATPPGSKPFGKTVVFRPALANTQPSPAYLFRLARYTDKLVVAYTYAKPGQDLEPKPVNEIFGVPVPPELRGKILVSGDPEHVMADWKTLATLFERQLEAVGGSDLTVVAQSAGGVDAVETRRRLEAAGKGNAIGKLVNVSAPMRGAPLPDEAFFGLFLKGIGHTPLAGHVPAAARALDPDVLARAFSDRDQRLVDLAVSNSLEGPGSDNARPIMKMLSTVIRLNPFHRGRQGPNDGWVQRKSMEFGRDILRLDRGYDHPGMGEDPAIIDDIARRLAGVK